MKRFTIEYTETYAGTFTVELDDDATESDAINELIGHADRYQLGGSVELIDSDAEVTNVETASAADVSD